MARLKKDPSKAGVSAASVKGDAGPGGERAHKNKKNSQNNQFKRQVSKESNGLSPYKHLLEDGGASNEKFIIPAFNLDFSAHNLLFPRLSEIFPR